MTSLATNPTKTNFNSPEDCDDCKTKLMPVLDELYCNVCDIGETCLPGNNGDFNHCEGCKIRLAVWYPIEWCPKCINN